MADLQHPLPKYLTEKKNIVRLIILTATFALVFINIYAPFGSETWFNVTKLEFFAYSSLVILTGVLVVVISRIIMYQVAKRQTLVVWHYLVWVIAEVFFMALFYTLFEKFKLHDPRFILDLFKVSAKNTALVLLLPYSVLWLYFSWIEKKSELQKLTENPASTDTSKNMIPFHDEKGELRFSVKIENLLYLESADNYVNIYYIDKEKIARFTLRNTIKRLEETLNGTEIIRCHRSYMVNFEKVKILRKDKDELSLELDVPSAIALPVSKTYVQSVMETFTKFSLSKKV
ncbi:MAG: LytTR family transcriptional regulator DNA-binding domain-containing protein [Bacteroidales bacterium]|nr:LytTR family transcriptional regulator DNA-binding domain-containing protein [Bacteroidales bacterium]HRX31192.1 LytTR family DNA-binding domain-containing protein [Tenuifilaceae bacterium]